MRRYWTTACPQCPLKSLHYRAGATHHATGRASFFYLPRSWITLWVMAIVRSFANGSKNGTCRKCSTAGLATLTGPTAMSCTCLSQPVLTCLSPRLWVYCTAAPPENVGGPPASGWVRIVQYPRHGSSPWLSVCSRVFLQLRTSEFGTFAPSPLYAMSALCRKLTYSPPHT